MHRYANKYRKMGEKINNMFKYNNYITIIINKRTLVIVGLGKRSIKTKKDCARYTAN